MLKYLDNVFASNLKDITQQNLDLFLQNKEDFQKVKDIIYHPIVGIQMYSLAVDTKYEPLIAATREELERSVNEIRLRLNK